MNPFIKQIVVCSALLAGVTGVVKAQQQSYTQYMENLTPINAAWSVSQPGGSANLLVRKQWVGVTGSPSTYLLDAALPLEKINASAGVIVRNDVFAIEHETSINAFFAKSIRLNETQSLAVSMTAGIRNYVANYTQVDASDPLFANNITETKPDIGFGVMFFAEGYYFGISVPQITIRPLGVASQQIEANFKNNYYLSGGYSTMLNEDFKIKFAGLAAYAQSVPLMADVSTMIDMKNTFGVGINYRTNNEMAAVFALKYDQFKFGYSYQFGTTNSNIGGLSNATHELTVGLRFGKAGTGKGEVY